MTYRNVKYSFVNSMIVGRSTIRNQDYLVISSFAERLFVRDIKTYIFHIRTLLTVMHRSVVLRRKHAVLRAAMYAKNANSFSASASGLRHIAFIRRSDRSKKRRTLFSEQSRMRVLPLIYNYCTFRFRIYKYMLVCSSRVGAYVPAAEERMAAQTSKTQSGTIKFKYFVLQNKQLGNVRGQLEGDEKGNACLYMPWCRRTMLSAHALHLHGRQDSSEATQTLKKFVWRIVYANILQRRALYYTIFRRNWRRGFASLPVKRQTYTVLRSPHTDKKSREQFKHEYRRKVKSYPSFVSIPTKRYIVDRSTAGLGIKSKQTQMVHM